MNERDLPQPDLLKLVNERGQGHLPGLIGVIFTELTPQTVRAELTVRPELLAPNGFLHAASVIALADTACGYGCRLLLPEFAGLKGIELLTAVCSWVHDRLRYVPGSSRVTDGAVGTLLARRGVCRDYAHLVIALLRSIDVPARMAAVYAPGLSPMDFHAVAEALVDGKWHVVDATGLAPRQSLLRIATGRDAADIAFLTNHWANLTLVTLTVSAVVDELPFDDFQQPVSLR